jgi:hypothetical protein
VAALAVVDSVEVDSGVAAGFIASVRSSLMLKIEECPVRRDYICCT